LDRWCGINGDSNVLMSLTQGSLTGKTGA